MVQTAHFPLQRQGWRGPAVLPVLTLLHSTAVTFLQLPHEGEVPGQRGQGALLARGPCCLALWCSPPALAAPGGLG